MIAAAGANTTATSHSLPLAIDASTKAATTAAATTITDHRMIRRIIPPSSTPYPRPPTRFPIFRGDVTMSLLNDKVYHSIKIMAVQLAQFSLLNRS
jgi:hypothetical protein